MVQEFRSSLIQTRLAWLFPFSDSVFEPSAAHRVRQIFGIAETVYSLVSGMLERSNQRIHITGQLLFAREVRLYCCSKARDGQNVNGDYCWGPAVPVLLTDVVLLTAAVLDCAYDYILNERICYWKCSAETVRTYVLDAYVCFIDASGRAS